MLAGASCTQDDGPSAFAFYSGLFGWTKAEAMDMGPMGIYQIFAIDGEPVRRHDDENAAIAGPVLDLLFQCRRHRAGHESA